jgi:hypothetical protein
MQDFQGFLRITAQSISDCVLVVLDNVGKAFFLRGACVSSGPPRTILAGS